MAKRTDYAEKEGLADNDEIIILDKETNKNKRSIVSNIANWAVEKIESHKFSGLNTDDKTLVGAINEVDAKNDAQDKKISTLESGVSEAGTKNTEQDKKISALESGASEAKTKNTEQDKRLEAVEEKIPSFLKATDVDSTLSVSGSPADAKVVGEQFKKNEEAITDLADKKITKFYASNQGNTHLPDSDKGKIQDMFLYGKSEQVQYKGKNLLNYTRGSTTVNGVTFTVKADKTITVNGTATNDATFILTSDITNFFDKADSIKAIGCPSGGSSSKFDLRVFVKNVGIFYDYGSGVVVPKTEETNSNVIIVVRKGYTASNLIFKPMIVDNSLYSDITYDDYEPYTGGIHSPNPNYPQEIKAVVNPKVVVRGKNLLKATLGTKTIGGVTCIANGDGTYTVNGTAETNVYFYFVYESIVLKKPFSIVGCPSGGSNLTYCLLIYNNATKKFITNINEDSVKVDISDYTIFNQFCICIKKGTTVNNLLFKPMLTYDMSVTYDDYEPYTEQSTTLPYTLYAIPVTTGGNITIGNQQYVADYVDVERGKLVRMCKEIDFAKTKQALYNNSLANTKESRYRYKELNLKVLADSVTYENGAGYVNRASLVNTTWSIDRNGIFSHGQGTQEEYVTLRVPKDKDAREYFTEIGGCKGIFQIDTPEEIDLTPDQIQAFKSLATNYPVTNIEVSSDQLDGYTVFNYPISMAEGWNYVKQQIGDTRDYIYDMDLQSAEAYVNSEYAVALTELEVM